MSSAAGVRRILAVALLLLVIGFGVALGCRTRTGVNGPASTVGRIVAPDDSEGADESEEFAWPDSDYYVAHSLPCEPSAVPIAEIRTRVVAVDPDLAPTPAGILTSPPREPRRALALWVAAREAVAGTGWTPLLVQNGEWDWLLEREDWLPPSCRRGDPSVGEAIFSDAEASLLDYEDGSGDWTRELARMRDELGGVSDAPALDPSGPGEQSYEFLSPPFDSPVRLFILPVPPEEVIAALGFGGWNAVPDSAAQALVHAYWRAGYGAEPVYHHGDFLEFYVARPPTTATDRRRLTWEQFVYAPDVVLQGTDTLPDLAEELRKHRWFFWWD